ncbi:MAG: DUF2207 domain-containing protein [Deltaproteobacteria bacterium]|nr:DUF2207 domain-containing protein [Deltaproteobacteria bacterium]
MSIFTDFKCRTMRLLPLLAALVLAIPFSASAGEEILSFVSHIEIETDGSLAVREEITVRALGREIRRGIYRDFPTVYQDRYGNRVRVGFDLVSTAMDGDPVRHRQERLDNGVRIYLGDPDVMVPVGEHTYVIEYRTTRQLGFFENHDELYWNVTGTDWNFPILKAVARVHLPQGADVASLPLPPDAYTGPFGAKGRDWEVSFPERDTVEFRSTAVLSARSGLTIAVAWPKGLVTEPSESEKLGYIVRDNLGAFAALFGVGLVFLYYMAVWIKVGRDPEKGTIIPRFEPPKGMSPAGCRYLIRMGYDDKTFAVAVVDAAVKGGLRIEQSGRRYSLHQVDANAKGLSRGEQSLMAQLFRGAKTVEVKQDNHVRLQSSVAALKKTLAGEFDKAYFAKNRGLLVPGVALSALTLMGSALLGSRPAEGGFITLWLTIWMGGTVPLLVSAFRSWRAFLGTRSIWGMFPAMGQTLFALPFAIGSLAGLGFFVWAAGWISALALLVIVSLNWLFFDLIKAPTRAGRTTMDEIEGFKLYLETAEEGRLNFLHPPDRTPELFEKFLPYAMALDVENRWAASFEQILAKAGEGEGYSPTWYSGRSWATVGAGAFSSALGGSLAGAVASSSKAPGSSSGMGGGGSSGGGGGGGGGGGW